MHIYNSVELPVNIQIKSIPYSQQYRVFERRNAVNEQLRAVSAFEIILLILFFLPEFRKGNFRAC